jgi:hypothetical protein
MYAAPKLSIKEQIASALGIDAARPLTELKRGLPCEIGYARIIINELVSEGRAHVCAVVRPHRIKLYRKGARHSCPNPLTHINYTGRALTRVIGQKSESAKA